MVRILRESTQPNDPGPPEPDAAPVPGRGSGWRHVIPLLTFVVGTLFAASSSAAHGTDLRGEHRTKLTELIAREQRRYQSAQDGYRRLWHRVDALARRAGERDQRVRQAQRNADALAARSGFTRLTGAGVRVTLDDAPSHHPGFDQHSPGGPSPDDLVVHQQDVQAVVNALWAGGASGLQIMDQRLITTSAVRCVGNTLILQGVVYSPPFRITATGDPRRLRAALDGSPEIQNYRQYVTEYGLGYTVKTLEKTTLPAYSGNVTPKYATVPEPDGADIHP